MITKDFPVLKAERVNALQLRVWCEHCNSHHQHGLGNGRRIAHCVTEESPYRETGYILEEQGNKPHTSYVTDEKGIALVTLDLTDCWYKLSSRGKAKLQMYINGHTMFGILYDYEISVCNVSAEATYMNIKVPGNHATELIEQFRNLIKDERNIIDRNDRGSVKYYVPGGMEA